LEGKRDHALEGRQFPVDGPVPGLGLLALGDVRPHGRRCDVDSLPFGEVALEMLRAPLGPLQGPLVVHPVVGQEIVGQFLDTRPIRVRDHGPAAMSPSFSRKIRLASVSLSVPVDSRIGRPFRSI